MKLKQYQIDAFAARPFEGNPAAVCPLESWLDDELLQAIAEENNLSETAFFVPSEKGFNLRWFTPVRELDLCGHATLAAAHVIFDIIGYSLQRITFETRSGELFVQKRGERLEMDFPASPPLPCGFSEILAEGLGKRPLEVWASDDYLVLFDSEATLRAITPDYAMLCELDLRGVIITAPGIDVDFVSRFFAPKFGIHEDPVTGSAHCTLAPYWAYKLGKHILTARQVSRRGGDIVCEVKGDRVLLSGSAVMFMEAEITL
ncbi:PhzF family phenazine biosynthesis protein [Chlorobium sp. BLA1]|uniref:PhzF family phenazine biosynthesis protein n=1 Tax=Candidatus Chlorobium masyuteum TaxID=2716876 RepID=UPI001423EB0E|nr:PhzF family phenazine biosynthesis protein [Candidatus Chlorobium masyuteum]NHQ60094.1 PhzF family phenazine biosynthesis protein [Candidatus Chlorobium masyuteum]